MVCMIELILTRDHNMNTIILQAHASLPSYVFKHPNQYPQAYI